MPLLNISVLHNMKQISPNTGKSYHIFLLECNFHNKSATNICSSLHSEWHHGHAGVWQKKLIFLHGVVAVQANELGVEIAGFLVTIQPGFQLTGPRAVCGLSSIPTVCNSSSNYDQTISTQVQNQGKKSYQSSLFNAHQSHKTWCTWPF